MESKFNFLLFILYISIYYWGDMLKIITFWIMISQFIVLTACHSREDADQLKNITFPDKTTEQQFKNWYTGNNRILLDEYRSYLAKYLKNTPNVFQLSYNQSNELKGCEQYQFTIPPKQYWKNIINSLKLIEKLQMNGLFDHYRIVHAYSPKQANACFSNAIESKHDSNSAVDIQLLNEQQQIYHNQGTKIKELCQFWIEDGREYRMGLGIYNNDTLHIDTLGYRTWGIGRSTKRSPCLVDN